jgi:hypothetical protein
LGALFKPDMVEGIEGIVMEMVLLARAYKMTRRRWSRCWWM